MGDKEQVVTLPPADVRVSVDGWDGALSSKKEFFTVTSLGEFPSRICAMMSSFFSRDLTLHFRYVAIIRLPRLLMHAQTQVCAKSICTWVVVEPAQ